MEIQTQDGVSYMINTDKYKGHTPADEWRMVFTTWCKDKQMLGLNVEVYDLAQMQACDPDLYLVAEANQDLARNAPLLLAEVKRLQEENKKLKDAINRCGFNDVEHSCLDLYCESMVERCPTCDENVESGLCDEGCEVEWTMIHRTVGD